MDWMKISAVIAATWFVGCAGIGFTVDPSNGHYAMTLSAEDCIDTTNAIGSGIQAIPWVGPKVVAVFGCPPSGL